MARTCLAYLFVNKHASRTTMLVHDGTGMRPCARRLYQGSFTRAVLAKDRSIVPTHKQLQAIGAGTAVRALG